MLKSNKSKVVLLLIVIAVAGATVLLRSNSDKSASHEASRAQEQAEDMGEKAGADAHSEHSHSHAHSNVAHPDVKANQTKAMTTQERERFIEESLAKINKNERESVLALASVMTEFTLDQGHGGMPELVKNLKAKKLNPYVMNDGNADTGSLSVVRTKSTLPGTRYFHAQIFKDDEGRDFIQHVSFEFKPGEYSFDAVKAALMKQANITSAPVIDKEGFISWSVGPYSVWAKVQTQEDFKDDVFNAHDKNDVGTIRAAFELEIHDHEAPTHHVPADEEAP